MYFLCFIHVHSFIYFIVYIIYFYLFLCLFLGKPCKFMVQTVDAGAGVLNVQLEGPSKVRHDNISNFY